MSTHETAHDVIVVGSGHNGLTAACYLQRAGLDVLVIEARDRMGGMTTSERAVPEAPEHVLNLSGIHYVFFNLTTIARDLDLARHGFRLNEIDPPHAVLEPNGGSIVMWRDARRTAEEIRRFSRRDASAYIELVETLDRVLDMAAPMLLSEAVRPNPGALGKALVAAAKGSRSLSEIIGIATASAADVAAERFTHPLVRGLFASQVQGCTEPGSGSTFVLLPWLHRFPSKRPVGGTGAIVDALSKCFAEAGGAIRLGAPVEEILVDGSGAACGVRLEDGETLRSSAVIANCDVRHALADLLPEGALPPRLAARAKRIPTKFSGGTQMKIDMALAGRIDAALHNRWRDDGLDVRVPVVYQGDFDQLMDATEKARTGELAEFYPYAATVPTAFDPTQAPEGQDTLWIWVQPLPYHPRLPKAEFEHEVQQRVFADLGQYYTGLESEIGRSVESWQELEQRTRAPHGNWAHVDFQLMRNGPLRPAWGLADHRSPVKGLYLASAGTHPGPGISGIPGQLAARALMRDGKRGLLAKIASRNGAAPAHHVLDEPDAIPEPAATR